MNLIELLGRDNLRPLLHAADLLGLAILVITQNASPYEREK
jgi:hypothetical protein